jgi:D-alanyl-D-alanine endopeptidase (penicillin-binding protein 7)
MIKEEFCLADKLGMGGQTLGAMMLSNKSMKSLMTLASGLSFLGLSCTAIAKNNQSDEKPPRIASASAIVVSVPVGQVLFEKQADDVRPVASLSKLMSAIVFMEQCRHVDLDALHQMSPENRMLAKGGDRSRLTTNWSYSNRDLLKAALMRSDNRAMPALMQSCGMILQEFAMHMNRKAIELGLKNTSFTEPNGLSKYNVSTAREFTKVILEASRFEVLNQIMQTKKDVITGYKNGRAQRFQLGNTDILIGRKGVDVIGAKTGYTDIARYCFTVLNRLVDNSAVAMVFLGAEGRNTRFGDFSRVHKWLTDRVGKYFAEEGRSPNDGT